MVLKKKKNKWALVSRTNPKKVLKWFGSKKPTKRQLTKEERRINYYKHKVRPYKRRGKWIRGHTRRK